MNELREALVQDEPWDASDMAHRPGGLSIDPAQPEQDELKQLVNELFTKYLDVMEVSDSGKEFHPIYISCCRAAKLKPLGELLGRLRELSK